MQPGEYRLSSEYFVEKALTKKPHRKRWQIFLFYILLIALVLLMQRYEDIQLIIYRQERKIKLKIHFGFIVNAILILRTQYEIDYSRRFYVNAMIPRKVYFLHLGLWQQRKIVWFYKFTTSLCSKLTIKTLRLVYQGFKKSIIATSLYLQLLDRFGRISILQSSMWRKVSSNTVDGNVPKFRKS